MYQPDPKYTALQEQYLKRLQTVGTHPYSPDEQRHWDTWLEALGKIDTYTKELMDAETERRKTSKGLKDTFFRLVDKSYTNPPPVTDFVGAAEKKAVAFFETKMAADDAQAAAAQAEAAEKKDKAAVQEAVMAEAGDVKLQNGMRVKRPLTLRRNS